MWRIGNKKTDASEKVAQELARNWGTTKNLFAKEQIEPRRLRIDELIVYATGEESYFCESALDSNTGSTEQGEFLVRCKRTSRSWDSEQFWSVPRSQLTLDHSESQRNAWPRFWLPLDTRNTFGTSGNVFESLLAREGPSSALFENSQNLASSSCPDLGPGITGNMKANGRGVRREPQSSSIPTPCSSQDIATMKPLNSYWRNLFSQWYDGLPEIADLGNASSINSQTLRNFKAGKSTARLQYVQSQQSLTS